MKKAKYALTIIMMLYPLGVFSQTPIQMRIQFEMRIQNNLYEDAVKLFPTPNGPATLSPTPETSLWGQVLDLFVTQPSPKTIESAQAEALDLLMKLKDPRCLPTLLNVSRFTSGYSSYLQHKARVTLKDLFPIFEQPDRTRILQSFNNDLIEMKEFYNKSFRREASEIRKLEFLIQDAEKKVNAQKDQTKPNFCLMNYVEAGKAFLSLPLNGICGIVDAMSDNPLGIIGGAVESVGSAVITLPNTLVGVATGGAYGSAGKELGNNVGNLYLVVSAVKNIKPNAAKNGTPAEAQPIFRGDTRSPTTIFRDGMLARQELWPDGSTPVIYATADLNSAASWAVSRAMPEKLPNTYVYVIDPKMLKDPKMPYGHTDAITVTEIPAQAIKGAYKLETSKAQYDWGFDLERHYSGKPVYIENEIYR